VEAFVLADRRVKVSTIAYEMSVSECSVIRIMHNKLGMSKVSCRWVPRMLTPLQKQSRVEICHENLSLYEENMETFCSLIVTGDETWVYYWDPSSKQESVQWKHKTSPAPVKLCVQLSAGKVIMTVFWDCHRILLVEYMAHKSTVTADVYVNTLKSLRDAVNEKRCGLLSRSMMLLHDNAPVHKAKNVPAAIAKCGFQEMNHPPYRPNLALCDYFLFRHLKQHLWGRRFSSDTDVQADVTSWLEDQVSGFYLAGMSSLPAKWNKCIELRGGYIEK